MEAPPWSKWYPRLLTGTLLGTAQLIPVLTCFHTVVFMLPGGWVTLQ